MSGIGHEPTPQELRHHVAYIGLAAYYWWVWAIYKDACGDAVGTWTHLWYRWAKDCMNRALAMYEES